MRRWPAPIILMLALAVSSTGLRALAISPGLAPFERTWQRTDKPVLDGDVARTWMWGPEAFTAAIAEPYAEAPGGLRTVHYFDKARMEDNRWRNASPPWDVTNGLLVVELVTGRMQSADATFIQDQPAEVNVVGDEGFGVTYAVVGENLDQEPYAEVDLIDTYYDWFHVGPGNAGEDVWFIGEATPGDGTGFFEEILAFDIHAARYVAETNHTIAAPFWEFMNSTGVVHEDGQSLEGQLFESPFFVTGLPISEPNWTWATVGGQSRWVLFQCFERRCLTYTPGNPEGFIVEAGNVGRHYYTWRYGAGAELGVDDVRLFQAQLSGGQEVPPIETQAGGVATFAVAEDHESIDFTLSVQNIENATAAYIHLGTPDRNGPVGVLLWQADGAAFSGSGVLAERTFTKADFIGLALMDKAFIVLVRAMISGEAYVNVYTEAHPTVPTSPDPQPGEIRGQILRVE